MQISRKNKNKIRVAKFKPQNRYPKIIVKFVKEQGLAPPFQRWYKI